MPKLTIVTYPDPVLKRVCDPVTNFDDNLKRLEQDMIEAMLEAPGAGLAAPQVGIPKRLFVVNGEYFGEDHPSFAVVNPEFVEMEGDVVGEEGCLSLPGLYGEVKRARRVVVRAQTVTGQPVTYELQDWPARIMQHEFDHLEGILFPERMRGLKKQSLLRQMKKMAATAG